MDMEEIRYLLGGTVFARAKAYTDRIQDLNCEVAGNGVRHLSADVRGGGRSLYQTQVWLRENGSFVSASCSCPYNENGEGPCCKHIGALLMWDSESQGLSGRAPQKPSESPESIPGVVRGTANLQTPQPEEPPRRDSYASSLEMLFGKKWRGEEPESDYEARRLLRAYQEGALAEVDGVTGHAGAAPPLRRAGTGADPAARGAALAAAAHLGRRRAAVCGKEHPGPAAGRGEARFHQLRQGAGIPAQLGGLCP